MFKIINIVIIYLIPIVPKRIIEIIKVFAKTSFSSEVEYRLNALVELISVIGNLIYME